MMTRRPMLPFAAAAALALAAPAAAQHDHGAMQGHDMHAQKDPAAVAEGTVKNGVRVVEMAVTEEGFVPARVKANKGEKLRLVVTRKTDSTCAKEIVLKDQGIEKELPLNKAVVVELTPKASGEIHYTCGMGMVRGVVFVP